MQQLSYPKPSVSLLSDMAMRNANLIVTIRRIRRDARVSVHFNFCLARAANGPNFSIICQLNLSTFNSFYKGPAAFNPRMSSIVGRFNWNFWRLLEVSLKHGPRFFPFFERWAWRFYFCVFLRFGRTGVWRGHIHSKRSNLDQSPSFKDRTGLDVFVFIALISYLNI